MRVWIFQETRHVNVATRINEWFERHPQAKVHHVTQSECYNGQAVNVTVSIMYEEPAGASSV